MIKFKKNSLVLVLSLMGIGVYPVISANIAFAQTNSSQVVFLSNGTGGGAGTQESPYTDLKTALAQAKAKNAVLKLAGNVTYQGNTSTGTNIIPLDLGGVTIDGQGHTLTVRFSPLSLNGDVVMQNLKLELVNDEGILAREQTNYIYMNGYNLTLDNVDTKIGSHENMFATVVMGAGENVSTTPNNNRLTLTGSTTKLKEVIAGNANNTERTSDSVISIGKDVTVGTVRFSGKGSNVSGAVNVSSQSQHVSQYNGSNSGKDSLTLDLGSTFKSTAITDINELTILGSTNVSISDLSANTIKFAEGSNAVLNIQDSDATVKTVSGTGTVRINNGNKLTVTDPLSADLKVDIGGGFNQDINNYVVVPEGSKQFIKDINNSATASNKYQGQPVVTLEKDNNVVSAKITLPTGTEVGDNVFVTVNEGDEPEFKSVTEEDLTNGYIKVPLTAVGDQEQNITISEVQITDDTNVDSAVFVKNTTLPVTPATDNPQTQPPTDTDSTQTDNDSSQSGNGTPEEPPANPDQGESTETEGNPPTDSQNNDGENGETNSDQANEQNAGGTQEGSTEGTSPNEPPSETDTGVGDSTEQPPTTGSTTEGTTNGDQSDGQNTGGTQEGSTEGTSPNEPPSETDTGVGDNTEQPPTTGTTTEGTTNGDQTDGQNTGGTQEGSTENTGTQPTEQPSETDNGVGDSTEQPPTTDTTTEGTANGDQTDGQNTGGTQEGSTENTGTQPTEQPSETGNGVGDSTEQPPTTGSTTEGTTNGDQSSGESSENAQGNSTAVAGTENQPTGSAGQPQTQSVALTPQITKIKDVVVANAHSQVQTVLSLGQDLVASMTLPLPAQKHLNVWVKENVTKIKSYSTQDYQAYRTNSNLTQLGVSSLLNDNVWAGVILNDVRNNNHFANSVNGKNHLQMISVFTRIQHQNGLFVIADIGTGRIKNQWATEQESIKFKRSFNQAGLTVGAGLALDKLVITPKAGLRYSRLNSLSYNFDGVKVDEKALNVMSYFAGADIGYKIMIEPSVSVKPYVSAEYWRSKNRFNLQAQNEVLHFNVGNQYHLSAGIDVSYKNVSLKISGGKANGKDSSKQTTMKFALIYQW